MTIYGQKAVDDLMNRYEKRDGFASYVIPGALVDSYILTANGCKTTVIKEKYLNGWSSGYLIRMYNKTPKKYADVMQAIDDGDEERAEKLFYN